MSPLDHTLVQQLIHEEIRRHVTDALAHPHIIRTGPLSSLIARAYPNSGMTIEEIADEISQASVEVGVPLELTRRTG